MRELKAYSIIGLDGRCNRVDNVYYLKSEADKVIAELKDKCNMHDFFWDGCGFAKRGFKNSIAVSEAFEKLEAENKRLEKCCKEYDSRQRIDERIKFNGAQQLRATKRALWLARAERAVAEQTVDEWSRYKEKHPFGSWRADPFEYWMQAWICVEKICRKKAEEYK